MDDSLCTDANKLMNLIQGGMASMLGLGPGGRPLVYPSMKAYRRHMLKLLDPKDIFHRMVRKTYTAYKNTSNDALWSPSPHFCIFF